MHGDHVDALVATAPDGVAFDGLTVEEGADGFSFETPADAHDALDESALRSVARDSRYVANWYFWHAVAPQSDDRWAFCRWLEGADERDLSARLDALAEGVERTWGELRVTVTLEGAADRRYQVRHVDDADAAASALEDHHDPLDAREIGTYDPNGRYRPLRTAPSLPTGWRFGDLGPVDAVETVEAFYPATIPNWHRERRGDLDVTHWEETMDRQTGMYGLIKTWNRGEGHEHVEWVAEACCADSQCLKRREWEYDDDTPLAVDGGDGAFPCREPCSLVVAAARRWTKLEAEPTRTYEFELTESEKEQVEEIVDAVADGRAGEIREADLSDGANRYRARFLRAKRFDEAGNLSGTPTEPWTDEGDGAADGDAASEPDAE
jgi:hypothetical protein